MRHTHLSERKNSFKGENPVKRETEIEDRGKDEGEEEAGSKKNECTGAGAAEIGNAGAERLRTARSRRLREKNKPCLLPDRLLHRVRQSPSTGHGRLGDRRILGN